MFCGVLIDAGLLVILVFLVAEEGIPFSMAFLIALGTGVVGGVVIWGLTLGLGFLGILLGLVVYGVILTGVLMYFLELERREAAIITGIFLGVKVAILLASAFISAEANGSQEINLEELEEELEREIQQILEQEQNKTTLLKSLPLQVEPTHSKSSLLELAA